MYINISIINLFMITGALFFYRANQHNKYHVQILILKAKHNILFPEICSEINHKLKKPSKIARIRLRKHECKIPLAYQLEILCTLHSNTSLHLFLHSDRFYELILAPHQQWDSRNQYQDLIESFQCVYINSSLSAKRYLMARCHQRFWSAGKTALTHCRCPPSSKYWVVFS